MSVNEIQQSQPDYAYKSSMMGAPFEFWLGPDQLAWRKGAFTGRSPYGSIRRVRMSFRPMTMQNYRFLTEVWPQGAPKLQIASTSWKSLVEHERLDAAYSAFVRELNRRIGAASGATAFETGSQPLLYWPGAAILAGAAFALVALAVRAIQVEAYSGAAFIAAFFALFLWQAGQFFLRNRPGTYSPDAVPALVLPKV